jgi:hypothetical protein
MIDGKNNHGVNNIKFKVCRFKNFDIALSLTGSKLELPNPFQHSDAMWRHTFHLSLICMSFAQ